MGRGIVGRATVLEALVLVAMVLTGFSPAFGQERQAGWEPVTTAESADAVLDDQTVLDSRALCPTRFDYVILASFGDASSILSLSTYRFRSQTGFSRVPLTGFQRVAYRADTPAPEPACRPRALASSEQAG